MLPFGSLTGAPRRVFPALESLPGLCVSTGCVTAAPPVVPAPVGPPPSPCLLSLPPQTLRWIHKSILSSLHFFFFNPEGLLNFIKRPFPSTEPAVCLSLRASQRHSTLPRRSARSVPAGVHPGLPSAVDCSCGTAWASPWLGFLLRPVPVRFLLLQGSQHFWALTDFPF